MAILTSVPSLLLFVALAAVLPSDTRSLVLLIGGTGWVGVARLVRGEVMRVQQQTHVAAAQGLGLSPARIVGRHILPLALAPLWAILGLAVGNVILAESTLSFLHIGVPDDVHTWGKMLASARNQHHGWKLAVLPGFAIFLTVWAINSLADRFR
jgi:peptide/nickel transport system permease protein